MLQDEQEAASASSTAEPVRPAVVVTGGSRGIGYAIAERFARDAHIVVLVARTSEALEEAAVTLRTLTGTRVEAIALDITRDEALSELDRALAAHGLYCDVLVNNAGIGLSGPFEEQTVADHDRLVELNVRAPTRLMRHFLTGMRARGRGGIITIASLGGYVPGPYQAAYYASKAYVISLSEAVAHELIGTGITVLVVSPGPVATSFHEAMGAGSARYRTWLPQMTPERVANAAYFGFRIGRRAMIPGLINSLAGYALRILPRPVSVPIIAWLLVDPTRAG